MFGTAIHACKHASVGKNVCYIGQSEAGFRAPARYASSKRVHAPGTMSTILSGRWICGVALLTGLVRQFVFVCAGMPAATMIFLLSVWLLKLIVVTVSLRLYAGGGRIGACLMTCNITEDITPFDMNRPVRMRRRREP